MLLTSNTSNAVNDTVDHLLANCVVATGVVVGSILLAADQELGVEEGAVAARADLIDGRRVKVDEEGSGHVFASAGLAEEGLVCTRVTDIRGIWVGTAIVAKAVLKEVSGRNKSAKAASCVASTTCWWAVNLQLPGTVTQLGTGLTQVEVKNL